LGRRMSLPDCLRKLGYREFTALQREAFKKIAGRGFNVVIVAPTGVGKTEAAILPVFYSISRLRSEPISCVYITPLRALNRDISERISRLAECFGVSVALRHGDTPYHARKAIQKNPPQVLVTTPETLNYILLNEDLLKKLSNLKFVVLDELHEIIESKRGLLLLTVLYLVLNYIGVRPVIISLTATLGDENSVRQILSSVNKLPTEVVRDVGSKNYEIEVEAPSCTGKCEELAKYMGDERVVARAMYILEKIAGSSGVLVFTNTRTMAEYLSNLLSTISERLGYEINIGVHHGSLSREHREEVEKRFKNGELNAVVATSSLELGIDIGRVNYVVQYLSPRQATRLIQRIGRSGHKLGGVARGSIVSTNNLLHYLESIVLAKRAVRNILEGEEIYTSPLDVLSYALAVYSLVTPRGINVNKVYADIVQNALYKDLSYEDFMDVVNYLEYSRIIKLESGIIRPTRKTRLHVYKTSMIPSTREINVFDVTGRRVGALDEDYVVLNIQPGDFLVLAGSVWKILSYAESENKLYVERVPAPIDEAVVPFWEGENIPVEYKVAREVGSLLRRLGGGEVEKLRKEYGLKADLRTEVVGLFGNDKRIVVDYAVPLGVIFVNVFGGSKLNLMLKDLLSHYIKKTNPLAKVRAYSTPYAIVIRAGNTDLRSLQKDILGFFKNLKKFVSGEFLTEAVRESKTLLWRIYQVAQRFGAISPEVERVSNALLQAFVDTVIGREAFKEVLAKDYDIRSAQELSELIEKGVVRVEGRVSERISEFHREILEYIEIPIFKGMVFDQEAYLSKLLSRKVTLLCLSCGYYKSGTVADFLDKKEFSCPKCGKATLTLVKGRDISRELDLVNKLKKGGRLNSDEDKMLDELSKRATLLYRFKKDALLALSARGVGAHEAARILNSVARGGDLIQEIYESEKRFLMVKEYISRDH